MTFRSRPRKEIRQSRLVVVEIALGILSVIIFWREIWFLILWAFNRFTPPDNAPTGLEINDAWQTLLYVLLIMAMGFVLLLIYLARRGAYPVRNLDEIAARIPSDDSYQIQQPGNQDEPFIHREDQTELPPVPGSLAFNPPYLRKTMWDWIFPPLNQPDDEMPEVPKATSIDTRRYAQVYGMTIRQNLQHRFRDTYRGFFHQLRWFVGLRGYNAVIQKGELISTDSGRPYAGNRGLVISDFDGTYLLDASQNGQRTGLPPQVGWFGVQRVSRTKVLASAPLGRISKNVKGVSAFTSDGIEILADITGVFSLGLRNRNVDVSFNQPDHSPDSIYSLKPFKEDDGEYSFTIDDQHPLDEQDRRYIASRVEELQQHYGQEPFQKGFSAFDFEFDPERVVRALTSRPTQREGLEVEWREILMQYTKDVFQRVISNYSFNDLYGDINDYDKNRYPIDDIIEEVQWQVVREGMLTFRLFWVENEDDSIATAQRKDVPEDEKVTYTQKNIKNAPTVPQQSKYAYRFFNNAEKLPAYPQLEGFSSTQKFLRSRGIRVLAAEFDNVRPKLQEIEETRLYTWSSQLKKEIDTLQGEIDKQHSVIMNKAIAETQKDVVEQLLQIFDSNAAEDIALLEFLSALEEIVNRDDIESIIPRDFHSIIAEVRQWVQHGGK